MKETFMFLKEFHATFHHPKQTLTPKRNLLLMVIQKFSIVAYNNHSRIVFLEKEIANK